MTPHGHAAAPASRIVAPLGALVPEPLTISRIRVDRFGGWRDRSIELPDAPMVVVHGPNEAGKSTLAELILWLLVGPTGSAHDAQRFGPRGAIIGGSLRGRLGVQDIEASGEFKVLQNGAPNDRGLSVVCGDGVVDAGSWRERLGGVDQQVFAAVYRLWGEQLHVGTGVEEQLSKVALAAYGGRADPRELADELDREARRWSTSRAGGVDSVAAVRRRLADVDERIRAAQANADDHHDLVQHIELLEAERRELVSRRQAVGERQRVVDVALDVAGDRVEMERLAHELAAVDVEPAGWSTLIDDPETLRIAVADLGEAERELARVQPLLDESCQELGVTEAELAGVVVTDADLAAVAAAVARRRHADERLAEARHSCNELESELDRRRGDTDRAVDALGGATRADVERARSGADDRARLTSAIDRWTEAASQADDAVSRAGRAEVDLTHATDELRAAEATWSALGVEMSPDAWLDGDSRQDRVPTTDVATPRPWWLAAAVVALAAPVAFIAGQRSVAVGAVVLAVAVAALTRPGRSLHQRPSAGPEERGVLDADVARVAEAVVDARRRRVSAHDEHARWVAAATDTAERTRQALRQLAALERELQIALLDDETRSTPDPAAIAGRARSWCTAIDALAHERAMAERGRAAAGIAERCHADVAMADDEICSAIRQVGITTDVPLAGADVAVQQYRVAVDRRVAVERARARCHSATSRLAELTAPIADQITGWRRERVVEEAERLAGVRSVRRTLEDDLRSVSATVEARLGNDAAVRAAAAETAGEAELRAESVQLAAELVTMAEAIEARSERLGELRHRAEALEAVDLIGALSLERGALVEQRDEAAIAAATAAIAERLLRSVVDEYERRHQPTLVARTEALACSVAAGWQRVVARPAAEGDRPRLFVEQSDGRSVPAEQLSTGGRALLYLALRVAMAEHDARTRHVALPLICDDPVVHLDDDRAHEALAVLRQAADAGHQVILFTCHQRTVTAARAVGASVVDL